MTIIKLNCKICKKEFDYTTKPGRQPIFCFEHKKDGRKFLRKHYDNKRKPKPDVEDWNPEELIKWLPAEPLIRWLRRGIIVSDDWGLSTYSSTKKWTEMGLPLGMPGSTLAKLATPGRLISANHADMYAVRLGVHPMTIWGYDFYALEPEGGSNPTLKEARAKAGNATALNRKNRKALLLQKDCNQESEVNLNLHDKSSSLTLDDQS
jgi:hypothetical protein